MKNKKKIVNGRHEHTWQMKVLSCNGNYRICTRHRKNFHYHPTHICKLRYRTINTKTQNMRNDEKKKKEKNMNCWPQLLNCNNGFIKGAINLICSLIFKLKSSSALTAITSLTSLSCLCYNIDVMSQSTYIDTVIHTSIHALF